MTKSWRDILPVHPAADLFPLMSEAELRELGEDIKKNGLQVPIVVHRGDNGEYKLLDGRNRLDALELVGIKFELDLIKRRGRPTRPVLFIDDIPSILDEHVRRLEDGIDPVDPHDFVLSANAHRRHLTGEQKRELIAKLLSINPEKSDRQIAAPIKASHHTVGSVRADMQERGQIAHAETRTDTKGRKQPAKKKKKPREGKLPLPDCPICEGKGITPPFDPHHECGRPTGEQIEAPCPCTQMKRRANPNLYPALQNWREVWCKNEQREPDPSDQDGHPGDRGQLKSQDDSSDDAEDDLVASPEEIKKNIFDTIERQKAVARAYKKVLKVSRLDQEAKDEISAAIGTLMTTWNSLQRALAREPKAAVS